MHIKIIIYNDKYYKKRPTLKEEEKVFLFYKNIKAK